MKLKSVISSFICFVLTAVCISAVPVQAAETYKLSVANYKVIINGSEYRDANLPILNYEGRTYAPMRSMLEAAGCKVDFSNGLATVNSLNIMSEKLDSTLKDLTAANIKLETDIEREREIEQERKEFIANVSHELKTPLAIIKGYSSALKDNVREDKREHYLNQIVRQSNAISKLVEDMLELSRIESGHYTPRIVDFDLTMLTKNILEDLRLLAEEKNLHLFEDYSRPVIKIRADHMKIGQVINNFIYNAIRHTSLNGNIFIRISEKENYIRFEVENEGVNIAPDKLNKVWGRFYREEEARDKKTGGTGLGLAISEKILQAHGMDYGVENTKCGVMFYFSVYKEPHLNFL